MTKRRSLDVWADVVRADLERALQGLLDAGLHLHEARAQHPGEFVSWLNSGAAGIKKSYAYMLMAVAANDALVQHAGNLPADTTALYELTRLSSRQLTSAIKAGEIRPDTPRQQVRAVVARRRGREASAEPPRLPVGRFRTLVIDPPWEWQNTATRSSAVRHYETMTFEALGDIELPLAPDAHAYVWVPNALLRDVFDSGLLDAWKLDYRCLLTWHKLESAPGIGNWFRNNTEQVVFCTRGVLPTLRNDTPTLFSAPRGAHSAKPDSFFDLVERNSPGPYLEMFCRGKARAGWQGWGLETES